MSSDIQSTADSRFEQALEETGARDPREFYRGMLRELKSRDPDAYEEAVRRYRQDVLEAIANGSADPLRAWLEFGRELAQRMYPGRTVAIDDSGRAKTLAGPASWETLILHLPDERREKAVAVGLPPELTDAQRATVDLLALGKLKLPDS